MTPLTIIELHKQLEEEIKKGNSDSFILLTDDEEENGYHYAYYGVRTITSYDDVPPSSLSSKKDTIILG